MIPGWPYSVICALEPGRSSWTAPLDARRWRRARTPRRSPPPRCARWSTALISAGQWRAGDPDILIVADAGYDAPRLAYLLADLPVAVLGRMRSDRVLRRAAGSPAGGRRGRPRRHGGEFVFGDPGTWGAPQVTTTTATRLYGPATARSWDRLHPRLTRRSAWVCQGGPLPVIEGTVIRLEVTRLPSGAIPRPVWLWYSGTGPARIRGRPALARLLAPVRHRAHLPHAQADPRLDLPEDPRPRSRRHLDLADPGRLYPAAPGPRAGRRPAPPLGATRPAGRAHARPGPARIPEHPRESSPASRGTETRQARPRPATRITQPPPRHPPRRARRHHQHGQ